MALIAVYVVVGLSLGVYVAAREYEDGSLPDDGASAGLVGFFVACFWPVVVVVVALGIAAHWLARIIGRHP